MLVLVRGDVLVQVQNGCCFEEVVGCIWCQPLKVVDVNVAGILSCVGFVDVLASYCRNLRE